LILLAIGSCGCYAVLTGISARFDFDEPLEKRPILMMLGILAVAFGLYLAAIAVVRRAGEGRGVLGVVVVAAVVFRAVIVPSTPIQEIDIYRYAWDGAVVLQGISPFRYSPKVVREAALQQPFDRDLERLVRLYKTDPALETILRRIHYAELPTIYPPVSQAVFAAAALTTPQQASVARRLITLKVWFAAFDLATLVLVIRLLRLLRRPAALCIVYGWCPLVLKEIGNSGHLDAVAVCLTTLAVYLAARACLAGARQSDDGAAAGPSPAAARPAFLVLGTAVTLALAVGAKLYPVVLAPLLVTGLIRRWGWRGVGWSSGTFLLLVVWLLSPMAPWAGQRPARGQPQPDAPAAAAAPNASNPSLGLVAFVRRWEMNDFLFQILMENVRTPDTRKEQQSAWFAVVPLASRERLVSAISTRFQVDRWEAAFLVARTITAAVFVVLAGWFLWRAARRPDVDSLLCYAFLTVAWFWLLSPTQNPWYWTWAMPLIVFARSRVWLALSGLVLLYYLRFWLIYHYPNAQVVPNLPYHGAELFDLVVTWIEYAPWFLCLTISAEVSAWRRQGRGEEEKKGEGRRAKDERGSTQEEERTGSAAE
jgi:hypothetical protein